MDADQESTDDETLVEGLHALIADNALEFDDDKEPSHESVKAAHNADLSVLEQLHPAAMARLDVEYEFQDGYGKDVSSSTLDSRKPLAQQWKSVSRPRRFEILLSQPAYQPEDYERALEAAWKQAPKPATTRPLWETNPFLAPILGKSSGWVIEDAVKILRAAHPSLLDGSGPGSSFRDSESTMVLRDRATMTKAMGRLRGLAWPQQDDMMRQKAVARWTGILKRFPEHFRVGRLILADMARNAPESGPFKVISDILTKKSTKTLLARAGSVLLYIHYCDVSGILAFPLEEEAVYGYFSFLEATKAPPSRADGFLQAVGFMIGTVEPDGGNEVYKSERIRGSSMLQKLTMARVKRRKPYTVEQVAWLEYIVQHGKDLRDRVAAGYVLFMVYARVRNSDTRSCRSITCDFVPGSQTLGYVQVDVDDTKTGRSAEKRRALMPTVAPRLGVRSKPWADSWIEARRQAGLPTDVTDVQSFPLMPNPLLSGGWGDRPLTAGEVRRWTAELLIMGNPECDVSEIGSHSGKATILSWMSKVGADPKVRKFLGYHVEASDSTMAIYSRDLAAEPLRQVEKMLAAIRCGQFEPDSTRGGMTSGPLSKIGFSAWYPGLELSGASHFRSWPERDQDESGFADAEDGEPDFDPPDDQDGEDRFGTATPRSMQRGEIELEDQNAGEHPEDEAQSESSGSSSSAESSEVDGAIGGMKGSREALVGCDANDLRNGRLFFHNVFTTMHKLKDEQKFACGRVLRSGYSKMTSISFDWPKCKICFPP